jgi:hypothetical protein
MILRLCGYFDGISEYFSESVVPSDCDKRGIQLVNMGAVKPNHNSTERGDYIVYTGAVVTDQLTSQCQQIKSLQSYNFLIY